MQQKIGDATYTGESYNNIQTSRAQFYKDVYSLTLYIFGRKGQQASLL